MASIVLFNGASANNVMSNRVLLDAQLLEARGHEVMVIDLTRLQEITLPKTVDLFVGYQGWGHEIKVGGGRQLVEVFGCPYAVFLGDHPIHHAMRIAAFPKNTVTYVCTRNQQDFLRQSLGVRTDTRLYTSAVSRDDVCAPQTRDIETIVIGHAQSPDAFLAAQDIPRQVMKIIKEFLERWKGNLAADPVADFMRGGFSRVMELVENRQMAINAGRLLDLAARHTFRWNYVEELRKLPVTFVGDDWVAMDRRPDDAFTALPSVPYEDVPALYARAQVCPNLFAPYFDFHERIVDSMAQGAVAATSKTEWLSELFDFGSELLALPQDPAEIGGWLEATLSDPQRLSDIGDAGRKRVLADFDEETRIDQLLELIGEPAKATMSAGG